LALCYVTDLPCTYALICSFCPYYAGAFFAYFTFATTSFYAIYVVLYIISIKTTSPSLHFVFSELYLNFVSILSMSSFLTEIDRNPDGLYPKAFWGITSYIIFTLAWTSKSIDWTEFVTGIGYVVACVLAYQNYGNTNRNKPIEVAVVILIPKVIIEFIAWSYGYMFQMPSPMLLTSSKSDGTITLPQVTPEKATNQTIMISGSLKSAVLEEYPRHTLYDKSDGTVSRQLIEMKVLNQSSGTFDDQARHSPVSLGVMMMMIFFWQ